MGSYGTYAPYVASQVKDEFTNRWTDANGNQHETRDIRSTNYGHNLWGIRYINDQPVGIELWLVTWSPPKADNPQWIYKPMDETAGPCEVDCPLELLERCPCPPGRWAAGWRERVRKYHADHLRKTRRLANAKPGDVILVKHSCDYYTVAYRRGKVVVGDTPDGHRYRITVACMI